MVSVRNRSLREGRDHPPNPWAINLTSVGVWPASGSFGGVAFEAPNGKMIFADIYILATDYEALVGGIGGGSLRFHTT